MYAINQAFYVEAFLFQLADGLLVNNARYIQDSKQSALVGLLRLLKISILN